MRSVDLKVLKNKLSEYIRFASTGETSWSLTAVLAKLRGDSGLSIILVEQNSRVALGFSDRCVVLDKGRIVYDGASAALRDDPERLAKLIGVSE